MVKKRPDIDPTIRHVRDYKRGGMHVCQGCVQSWGWDTVCQGSSIVPNISNPGHRLSRMMHYLAAVHVRLKSRTN